MEIVLRPVLGFRSFEDCRMRALAVCDFIDARLGVARKAMKPVSFAASSPDETRESPYVASTMTNATMANIIKAPDKPADGR